VDFHLARRLVRTGNGADTVGRDLVLADQPGDLVNYDGGLTAARSCNHQERTSDVLRCSFLMRIKLSQCVDTVCNTVQIASAF
jgi:hypothetical protein